MVSFGWLSGLLRFLLKRGCLNASHLGKHGERLACRFLKKAGYRIVHRNWRYGHSELDIVALDGEIVVFVEVRLRDVNALVRGIESISRRKKIAMRRACYAYLRRYFPEATTYRFDVIDIEHDKDKNSDIVHHFENVQLF